MKVIFLGTVSKSGLFGKFLLRKRCAQDYEECCVRHMSKKFRLEVYIYGYEQR